MIVDPKDALHCWFDSDKLRLTAIMKDLALSYEAVHGNAPAVLYAPYWFFAAMFAICAAIPGSKMMIHGHPVRPNTENPELADVDPEDLRHLRFYLERDLG